MNYFIDYKMPEGIELENFEKLLVEEYGDSKTFQGQVILGTVTAVSDTFITVDVGLKSEGIISKKEFGLDANVKVGDKVDVYVEKYENRDGLISLSREKARREEAWIDLERIHKKGEKVIGVIFGRVKGGFTVDLKGAIAFLPGSQVDVRPIKDISPLMGIEQPFEILKMDKIRGNIVVSRRSILEEDRAGKRTEIMSNLKEGETVEGVVKNITDYGAFIDLGGIDGLLHVTDISWQRVNHPSEVLKVGQTIKAQIIRFNSDSQRVSLGLKQLENDPWKGVQDKYKVNDKIKGKVTNIADYGAFVELESGVEGLVHVSEMSWTRKMFILAKF
jgi:small subunit ribosomal protein S1